VLISPNVVTVLLVLANPSGFTQFRVLSVSNRNCRLALSLMLKFLRSDASRSKNPGPRTV
jgi:hypothetical protein